MSYLSLSCLIKSCSIYSYVCHVCLHMYLYIYLLNNLFMGTMSPKTLHCSKEDLSTGFPDRCPSSYRWSTSGNQGNLQMSTRILATYEHLRGVKRKSDAFYTRLDLKPLFFGQRSIQHIKCMVVLNPPLSLEVNSQPSKSHSSTMEPFLES